MTGWAADLQVLGVGMAGHRFAGLADPVLFFKPFWLRGYTLRARAAIKLVAVLNFRYIPVQARAYRLTVTKT